MPLCVFALMVGAAPPEVAAACAASDIAPPRDWYECGAESLDAEMLGAGPPLIEPVAAANSKMSCGGVAADVSEGPTGPRRTRPAGRRIGVRCLKRYRCRRQIGHLLIQ